MLFRSESSKRTGSAASQHTGLFFVWLVLNCETCITVKPYEQSLYMQYAGLRPGHSSMVMAGFFVVLRSISDGQYPTINIRHPAVILRNTQAVSRKEEEEEALREYHNTQEETRMGLDLMFLFNSILLGVGLAMDAFSVSLANGLNEPGMKKAKMCEKIGRAHV